MNAYVGQADAAAVARVVRERDVDVLVVVEASPAFVRRLDAEGLGRTHPYRVGDPRDDTADGSLISAGASACPCRAPRLPGLLRTMDDAGEASGCWLVRTWPHGDGYLPSSRSTTC